MLDKTKPLVSVIITAYNYVRFIGEAIDSVLNQTFPQNMIEVIVIDDGSTDDTRGAVAKYADRVTYIYQQNLGAAWALKAGIDTAQGKYIFTLDADDIFLPDKIKKIVKIFEKDEEIVNISHPVIYWYMDRGVEKIEAVPKEIKGRKIYGKDLLSYFYRKNRFFGGGSTIAGRAELWKTAPIKKDMTMWQDEYLILFALNSGFGFFLEEPLSIYRIHDDNYSTKNVAEKMEKDLRAKQTILSEILRGDFEEEIRALYTLKIKMYQLTCKEYSNKKKLSDIKDLWDYLIKHRKIFNENFFKIIINYRVIQRSFPSPFINYFRKIKQTYDH